MRKVKMQGAHLQERQKRLLELLEESGPSLHVLLARLTLREDAAGDLMQELFLKLSQSSGLDRARNRDAFARKAAINLAFDWRRKQKHCEVSLEKVAEPADTGETVVNDLIRREELAEVLSAVGRLNKASRDSVVMRYIDDKSYDYIAEQLQMTPHHIRALCHRARQGLIHILNRTRSVHSGKESGDV
jgi:RNA polymerase sigma-70 factor (ECF subfamily)